MAESTPREKSPGAVWPVVITILLLAAALYLGWLLWQKAAAMAHERGVVAERASALKAERDHLRHILTLSPCEAKSTLSPQSEKAPAKTAPVAAKAPSASKAATSAQDVENACVFIVSLAPPRNLSTGSGFFVAPGYVATNKHVVANSMGKILVTGQGLGKPALAKVVATSPEASRDYALLKVEMPRGVQISPLAFAPEARRTQKVGAWGFPNLVGKTDPQYTRLLQGDFSAVPELSYTEGVVSAVLNREPPLIVHTAPISPGNSGGPLVNENGEVVGINTMISLDEDSYRQASIALAASDLKKFLASHGLSPRQ